MKTRKKKGNEQEGMPWLRLRAEMNFMKQPEADSMDIDLAVGNGGKVRLTQDRLQFSKPISFDRIAVYETNDFMGCKRCIVAIWGER